MRGGVLIGRPVLHTHDGGVCGGPQECRRSLFTPGHAFALRRGDSEMKRGPGRRARDQRRLASRMKMNEEELGDCFGAATVRWRRNLQCERWCICPRGTKQHSASSGLAGGIVAVAAPRALLAADPGPFLARREALCGRLPGGRYLRAGVLPRPPAGPTAQPHLGRKQFFLRNPSYIPPLSERFFAGQPARPRLAWTRAACRDRAGTALRVRSVRYQHDNRSPGSYPWLSPAVEHLGPQHLSCLEGTLRVQARKHEAPPTSKSAYGKLHASLRKFPQWTQPVGLVLFPRCR